MSNSPVFLDLKKLSEKSILRLFDVAQEIEHRNSLELLKLPPAALVFFEPSTRTRLSFEMACGRLGLASVVLSGKSGTSLEKGESFEDTVLNVAAMKPSIMIVRAKDEIQMDRLASKVGVPWINAGWGKVGHPTQALLDALTIRKFRGHLAKERVLFVGDVQHSRVVSSHLELAKILGYEISFCGPKEFLFEKQSAQGLDINAFENLQAGLEWATVVIALRVQTERHEHHQDPIKYHAQWGLNSKTLQFLSPEALILHPGPVNHGVEIDSQVFYDPRCRVFQQVTQGVFLRQALISLFLKNPEDLL
ncbi:MAG: aspartate carbamoyltransferase catalytic subunit [Bdellovibrionota bacterium]